MKESNMDRAKRLLYGPDGLGCKNFGCTPGDKPGLTADELAGAIADSIERLMAGDFTKDFNVVADIDE